MFIQRAALPTLACLAAAAAVLAWWVPGLATPPVPCPGEDPDAIDGDLSQRIYGISYDVDQETAVLVATNELASETVQVPLDHIDATSYSLVEAPSSPTGIEAALILAGCDGSSTEVHVYSDDGQDGWLTDHQGAISLGTTFRIARLAVRSHTFEIFCLERETGRVLRLTDSTGDGVPDTSEDYVPAGETPLEFAEDLVLWDDGQLVVSTMGPPMAFDSPIRVYRDVDGDGSVDTVTNTTWGLLTASPPNAARSVMEIDDELPVIGSPLSVVELWETDAVGLKVSADPAAARIGMCTLDAAGRGVVPFALAVTTGDFITVFDVTSGKSGPTTQVAAAFARGEGVSVSELDPMDATTITISGRGFSASTRVDFIYADTLNVDLTPQTSVMSATELSVTVPVLGSEYCGTAILRVEDDGTPSEDSRLGVWFNPAH